ncbi:MAG TPA: PKD domain-containing protein [Candidatus Thermoplasmatota archaeon]|nr:PKD domain-containing protein [Candidatus Thermoplasmatota archaeon]
MRNKIIGIVVFMLLLTSSTAVVVAWNFAPEQKQNDANEPLGRDYREYGDAPEGPTHIAYPATGVMGAFPTCMGCGPASWIQHNNFGAWFGPTFDFEWEGNAGWCPGGFPPYDQDEGYQDGDAGLIIPQPFTINVAMNVVPFPGWAGSALGSPGQNAVWGVNVDIWVHNTMPNHEPYLPAFVNVLMDWNQNGAWGDAGEHVLVNFVVPPLYIGPLSALIPPNFVIGPNSGYVWTRFSITEAAVPYNWIGEGSFEDGETEDYLLLVNQSTEGGWYYKPAYANYAPQGMPDFNQTQDQWKSIVDGGNGVANTAALGDDIQVVPVGGAVSPGAVVVAPGPNCALNTNPAGDDVAKWAFCGPVAVANCFWWFDSKFDDPNGYPGDGVDNFSLVQKYGVTDDHLKTNVPPLIQDLAAKMNTTTKGTTNITDMKNAIQTWLINKGLSPVFTVNKYNAPNFSFIEDEIERCQDVILLLGFYNESEKLVDQMQMLFSTNDNLQPQNWWDYQSFVPSVNKLDAINITLVSNGPPCDVQINVYNAAGQLVGTSIMNPGALAAPTWVQFHFPSTILLNIGSTYYFDVREVPTPDLNHYEWFYFAGFNNYPPGQGWMNGVVFNYDWAFRTEYYPETSRLKGHFVTCAGVNSNLSKIAISDPELNIQNPAGNHNDAANVSHDIYSVGYGSPLQTLPYQWWLQNYSSVYDYAIVEQAVIVCPRPYNFPPTFGTPTPANGSTNNPRSFTWSIPINDPEGNPFSWTIQCSNGQTNGGAGAANGTKTLALSGLAYATTYKVWVNATDPPSGSGIYNRKWYTFTTKTSLPPVFGTPSPANGSTNNPLSFSWSISINDLDGDTFSWTIQCSNGQTNSGSGSTNGTKTLSLSGLAYSSTYKVWVNATDPGGSGVYTRRWYTFSTIVNLPPVFGSVTPSNGSANNPLSFTWSIPINDPEGNPFSWTIQCSNGQTNSGTGASNGTKNLALSGLAYATTYKVWVNATDPTGSGQYTRKWFTFSTQQQQNSPPNKPNKPTGPPSGKPNTAYTYSTSTTDPNGDQVYYQWDWGDGSQSNWLGPYNSGAKINTTHTWGKGSYSIKVKAKDSYGAESNWSDPLTITMPKNNAFNPLYTFLQMIKQFFDQFPHAFPLLRSLLGW